MAVGGYNGTQNKETQLSQQTSYSNVVTASQVYCNTHTHGPVAFGKLSTRPLGGDGLRLDLLKEEFHLTDGDK